jgi:hypothetical protein
VQTQIDRQYAQIANALKSGSPQALAALKNNPQVPAALKQRLDQLPPQALKNPQTIATILQQVKSGMDQQKPALVAQARRQALARALAGLDTAKAAALKQGQSIGAQMIQALKQSFATSITRIYLYAIWLVAAAGMLIALALPEIPLRKSNTATEPTQPAAGAQLSPARTNLLVTGVTLAYLARRIETGNGELPYLTAAASALVPHHEGSVQERALLAARRILRPLAAEALLAGTRRESAVPPPTTGAD